MSVNIVTNTRNSTRWLPIRLLVINSKYATGNMCFQRLNQLGENIRSAGKSKRQNSKLEKSRMAWSKLPRESQILAMIWKNVYVMVN